MKSVIVAIALFVGICLGADGQTKNPWILKLSQPFTPKLGILIQHGGPGVPLYDKSDIMQAQIVDYLKGDTLFVPFGSSDYKYFELAKPCDKFSPPGSYREYLINYKGRGLWVKEVDLMRVNRSDLGEYKVQGRILHAALMLPNPKADGDQCATITTIMMHDDQHLYLIDAALLNNPDLHWKSDRFLSLVDPPRMQMPEASIDAKGDFVLTWQILGEREKMKLTLTWLDNHIVAKSYVNEKIPDAVYGIPDDTTKVEAVVEEAPQKPKDETVYTDEIHSAECTYDGSDAGDCGHLNFSCGDFGDADTSQLSPTDSKLWNSVIQQGAYPGRTFNMTYKIVQGSKCGAPDQRGDYYSDGPIQGLLTFKLKKK